MKDPFKHIETPYVDAQTLLGFFGEYKKPRERIRRMVQNGELIRLKNGFYLIQDKIRQGDSLIIPYEQVANLLYGPSYVSLEWALSFYGMVPERVHTVTSMVLGRAKEYNTPIGSFSYSPLRASAYPTGVELKEAQGGFIGNFFIARPEKALADLVFLNCKNLNERQLEADLFESRRMDRGVLSRLDKVLLLEIAKNYRSKIIDYLVRLI